MPFESSKYCPILGNRARVVTHLTSHKECSDAEMFSLVLDISLIGILKSNPPEILTDVCFDFLVK